ncbi:MAG: hypothetical protein NC548_46640 [Lachnospiraceae bacterium]|nr:hypothetical protein [Lachnospiraceae bacterium]
MDILDNARIIKQLTDKEDVWELWQILCGINCELDEARHKIECIRDGKDCDDCEEWCFISTGRLLSIPDTSIMKQQVESLNLEALHTWLIDESTSKEDLQFRLNKIKGIAGSMWSRNDYVRVWCMLNGFKPTSDFEVGKEWEIKKGIIPTKSLSKQLYEVATQLDKSQSEDEVDKMVMRLNKVLLDWFKVVGFILGETYSMIEEAEQILNPQPTQTETEPQKAPRNYNSIMEDEDIKEVFDVFVERGYMEYTGKYYKWNKSHHLLAYFCEKVSLYFLNSTKTYEGKEATEWKSFGGLFEIDVNGKTEHPNNDRLRVYKNNWYRGKDRKKIEFLPDGYKGVEDILADLH